MHKGPIVCRQVTYRSTSGGAEITYFVPYRSTVYFCTRCHERFYAYGENQLYHNLKSTIQGKTCPTCHNPLRDGLIEQVIPLRNNERASFDEQMREQGYDQVSVTEDIYAEFYNLYT